MIIFKTIIKIMVTFPAKDITPLRECFKTKKCDHLFIFVGCVQYKGRGKEIFRHLHRNIGTVELGERLVLQTYHKICFNLFLNVLQASLGTGKITLQ